MRVRHQRFVDEYLVDLNATQAAIRAGYSPRTAKQQGQRLLTNADIQKAVAAANMQRTEKAGIDAAWVLQRLAAELLADVADLYTADGEIKPIKEWPLIWRQGLVSSIESYPEKIGEDDDGRPIFATAYKLKLSDRARRVEMLGKHVFVSAFREQVDHTSSDGSMSPPSLADFYGARGPVEPEA